MMKLNKKIFIHILYLTLFILLINCEQIQLRAKQAISKHQKNLLRQQKVSLRDNYICGKRFTYYNRCLWLLLYHKKIKFLK